VNETVTATDEGHTVPSPNGPLAGVRVVALEQAVARPRCSRHLADLGADVVKVKRWGGGDATRTIGATRS
jgi:crotonobetainyl-CoA:carnitine CoA-transferase CaiB-like acyl-CoA transferase